MSMVCGLATSPSQADGPGARLQGVGVLGGIRLARAELVEVVVGGDVLEGRLLLVDGVGARLHVGQRRRTATPGPRRPRRRGQAAPGAQASAGRGAAAQELPPAPVQLLGGDLPRGDGFTQLLLARHVYRTFCHGRWPALPTILEIKRTLGGAAQGISLPAGRATTPAGAIVLFVSSQRYQVGGPRAARRARSPSATSGQAAPTTSTTGSTPGGPTLAHYFNLAADTVIDDATIRWLRPDPRRAGAARSPRPRCWTRTSCPPTWIAATRARIEPARREVLDAARRRHRRAGSAGRPRCGRACSGWAARDHAGPAGEPGRGPGRRARWSAGSAPGLLLLVGVERGDTEADADATARKVAALRIFAGQAPHGSVGQGRGRRPAWWSASSRWPARSARATARASRAPRSRSGRARSTSGWPTSCAPRACPSPPAASPPHGGRAGQRRAGHLRGGGPRRGRAEDRTLSARSARRLAESAAGSAAPGPGAPRSAGAGPVARPVCPTRAIICPARTRSPTRTSSTELWA